MGVAGKLGQKGGGGFGLTRAPEWGPVVPPPCTHAFIPSANSRSLPIKPTPGRGRTPATLAQPLKASGSQDGGGGGSPVGDLPRGSVGKAGGGGVRAAALPPRALRPLSSRAAPAPLFLGLCPPRPPRLPHPSRSSAAMPVLDPRPCAGPRWENRARWRVPPALAIQVSLLSGVCAADPLQVAPAPRGSCGSRRLAGSPPRTLARNLQGAAAGPPPPGCSCSRCPAPGARRPGP